MKAIANRAARVSKRFTTPNISLPNRSFTRAALLISIVAVCGCVSKTKAKLDAQQAYIAGQQQAMMTMQANKTMVQIRGNVKHSSIPWTEGLTVAKAIFAAEYQGAHDPKTVRIIRNGGVTEIQAADILQGQDEPLQPGDIVEIR